MYDYSIDALGILNQQCEGVRDLSKRRYHSHIKIESSEVFARSRI
jgi:hypothetical protein